MKRRTFLLHSAAGAGALAVPRLGFTTAATVVNKPLDILVLGGTNFVGPAIVELALARGHNVTLFNRGITRPELFKGVEKLRGFRGVSKSDLRSLEGRRRWDVVIDVWAVDPALVSATAALLADRTDYYYFVSSIAAYRDFSKPGLEETAMLREGEPGYGGDKVASESIVASAFEDRFGVARCHAIFGARDPGSSLHYWLRRFGDQDVVAAPGDGGDAIQFVDVKDVATWAVRSIERKHVGVFNLAGPPIKFKEFLGQCESVVNSSAEVVWIDAAYVAQYGVRSFDELPLWIPESEDPGFFRISSSKAEKLGMTFRPHRETIADAWRWYQSAFFNDTLFPLNGWGMAREREEALLAAWQSR